MAEHAELEVRPAATVVVLRDGATGLEVLMLKRAASLKFFGGAWVFPGGRVEPEDGDLAENLPEAARIAAARELYEEAGLRVPVRELVCFARWLTPPGRARRFDTFYFAVPAPNAPVVLDPRESDDYRWLTPESALAAREAGEIELPPPTFVTLSQLQGLSSAAHASVRLAERMTHYVPRPLSVDGGFIYLYAGDAGYEASDPHALGARHRLSTVNNVWRYERD